MAEEVGEGEKREREKRKISRRKNKKKPLEDEHRLRKKRFSFESPFENYAMHSVFERIREDRGLKEGEGERNLGIFSRKVANVYFLTVSKLVKHKTRNKREEKRREEKRREEKRREEKRFKKKKPLFDLED